MTCFYYQDQLMLPLLLILMVLATDTRCCSKINGEEEMLFKCAKAVNFLIQPQIPLCISLVPLFPVPVFPSASKNFPLDFGLHSFLPFFFLFFCHLFLKRIFSFCFGSRLRFSSFLFFSAFL